MNHNEIKNEINKILSYDFSKSTYSYSELLKIIHFMKEFIYTNEFYLTEVMKENTALGQTIIKLKNDIDELENKIQRDYVPKVPKERKGFFKKLFD